jgi:hypothetical protein
MSPALKLGHSFLIPGVCSGKSSLGIGSPVRALWGGFLLPLGILLSFEFASSDGLLPLFSAGAMLNIDNSENCVEENKMFSKRK